jgi:hypothetical protein
MKILESDLHSLYRLLEEEVSIHRLLMQEIKKESECLRQSSVSSLMEVSKSIEEKTELIRGLMKEEQEVINKMLIPYDPKGQAERNLKDLLEVLTLPDRQRIKRYQKTLNELKERIQKTNDQNKIFTQECLNYISELISCLVQPVSESPGYTPKGDQSPLSTLSRTLYREV